MGWTTYEQLETLLAKYRTMAVEQFDLAVMEPKVTEADVVGRVFAAPLDTPRTPAVNAVAPAAVASAANNNAAVGGDKRLVMRKAMTTVIDELMTENKDVSEGWGSLGALRINLLSYPHSFARRWSILAKTWSTAATTS